MALVNRPPTEHGIEIETAEGAIFRLDADQLKAQDVPSGLSFSTQRGDGFATCTFTLNREIFKDWPDLNLLDTVCVIARDGSIDWEGLIQSFPRTNDPQQLITVNCVGYMTSLKRRPMGALIIDRRLSGWVEASTQRRANLYLSSFRIEGQMSTTWQAEGEKGPGVIFTFTTFDAVNKEIGEAWLYAGGEDIGAFRYDFQALAFTGSESWASTSFLSPKDTETPAEGGNLGKGPALNHEQVAATAGYKYAGFNVSFPGESGAGTSNIVFALLHPRIVGTHGLTARGSSPEEGYYVSDIIQYLLQQFGSKLTWEGEENQFLLQQCTWHDNPQTPYDAIQQLNNLVLWETNVWEDGKFYFEPADLTQADWQIRTSDPGVSVQFQGDSIESFANGVIVTYSDFFGHTYTLYPDEHAELQDENENNAAARHGEDIWTSYTVPWQCLEAEAIQLGRAYLSQNNRPKRPGSFTVVGHIQDSAGHWHRVSEVRCSQTIAVMDDLYEGEPRLIYATSHDEESDALTITVDATPQTLEAITARNTSALEARGLTSS